MSPDARRPPRLLVLKARMFATGTQRELSLRAGIPETRLSAIVNGRAPASAKERAALAGLLHTDERLLFAPDVDVTEAVS